LNINVKVEYVIGKTNVYDEFSGDLDVAGAWVVTDSATGEVETVSAVAVDAVNKTFDLTVTAGTYDVKLANAAALEVLGVGTKTQGGFESDTVLSVVVPAT